MNLSTHSTGLLERIPKVELHLHLDGSVKPETIIELATKDQLELPVVDPDALSAYMKVERDCKSLKEYLQKFDFVLRYLQTAEALERTAFEVVEQSARHHCRYIEVRFAPQLHRENELSIREVITRVLSGLRQGEKQYGVQARAIAILLRGHTDQLNLEVVRTAAEFLDKGLVAVDLAGDEASFPPHLYIEQFRLAQALHLPITIHAGESAGPGNILDAIEKLGASRIGHGVRLREDPDILQLVKERGIPLEMCPTSNMQTKAAGGWFDYPLRDYLHMGIRVTVNTDNLTVSNTNLSKEYELLMENLGLTWFEVRQLVMNAADASFLSMEEREALRQRIVDDFSALGL